MGAITIGVDIGQKRDPTAIAVAEIASEPGPQGAVEHFNIRHLERLPLGTSYPAVATRLGQIAAAVAKRLELLAIGPLPAWYNQYPDAEPVAVTGRFTPRVFVDATGVGLPVVDLLTLAGVAPIACYFTHGDRRNVELNQITIGKAWLVSRLQALFQTDRIHLPATDEARQLARELQDYEIRVDERANDTYGAFRVGTHDDLVTALGLAVQEQAAQPTFRMFNYRSGEGYSYPAEDDE